MIRRGNLKDVALLQRIGRKTFDDTFGNTCTKEDMRGVLDLYFNAQQCEEELNDPTDNFFFHELDGEATGYMRINAKHECPLASLKGLHSIELVRLYVLKEYHGAGVANALMDFAVAFAKEAGYEKM
ncbi:MAG: GNAT family N-acetyltransferase, partial [Sphingomonadales bacterium]|nr:GNAT family N-acetyltransferase [Sphingomonadales bacterium]